MKQKIAEVSKDTVALIQKAEQKIGETGHQVILIAYEAEG